MAVAVADPITDLLVEQEVQLAVKEHLIQVKLLAELHLQADRAVTAEFLMQLDLAHHVTVPAAAEQVLAAGTNLAQEVQ
jgi:hypothetical protein